MVVAIPNEVPPYDFACKTPPLISKYAQDAVNGCEIVLYSTVFFSNGTALPDPRQMLNFGNNGISQRKWCYILIASDESAAEIKIRFQSIKPWVMLSQSEIFPSQRRNVSTYQERRASRVSKLLPHWLFPASEATIFVDWKLRLSLNPAEILRRTVFAPHRSNVGFAVFRHPCTTNYSTFPMCVSSRHHLVSRENKNHELHLSDEFVAKHWWHIEMSKVCQLNKTSDIAEVKRQQLRYLQEGLDMRHYADAAIIIRVTSSLASHRVNCGWWEEYSRPWDSGDRDQPALAAVLARNFHEPTQDPNEKWTKNFGPSSTVLHLRGAIHPGARSAVLLLNEGPKGKCEPLCHWYVSSSLARLRQKVMGSSQQ